MMKQLFFVLFLATVVLMVSANTENEAAGDDTNTESEGGDTGNGASMTTLTTASLIGLAFNVLMNFWQ